MTIYGSFGRSLFLFCLCCFSTSRRICCIPVLLFFHSPIRPIDPRRTRSIIHANTRTCLPIESMERKRNLRLLSGTTIAKQTLAKKCFSRPQPLLNYNFIPHFVTMLIFSVGISLLKDDRSFLWKLYLHLSCFHTLFVVKR